MFKNLAAALTTFFIVVSTPTNAATTFGTDMSDFWYNPNESGWGVNIGHQGEVLFMTMFVYSADNSAKWYAAASGMNYQAGTNPYTFSGPLYETRGPYLGVPFNSANVFLRQVGTATVTLSVSTGTLSYSVDGVTVNKSIQRQTFRNNNLSGNYVGATVVTQYSCGPNSVFTNQLSISHSGNLVSIAAVFDDGLRCTYSATYSQVGRMGSMNGSLSCSNGGSATFQAFEIESGYQGFFGRYTSNYSNGCTESGRLGGMRY